MSEQTWGLIQSGIASIGFPIFVAIWLLYRSDKILGELRDAVSKLIDLMEKQGGRL